MRDWIIALVLGFLWGYGVRYVQSRIRRTRRAAKIYKGRWPVFLVLCSATQACDPPPRPHVIYMQPITITVPAETYQPKGCLR